MDMAQPPEGRLSDADRDYLAREDLSRERVTIGELARMDMDHATTAVELVEADLPDDPGTEADPADPTAGIPHRFGIGNVSVASHMRAIAKLCRERFGLRVLESPGWATRGRSNALSPTHVIAHHTAASVDVTNLLINGRPDLAGPLCNWALLKDGTVVLIASGRANHAGNASVSSSQSLGIEATGPVPISARGAAAFPNYAAHCKLLAAHRLHFGWGNERVRAHKEICIPAGRKIDVAVDMNAMRAQVSRYMGTPVVPIVPKGWDEVATKAEIQAVVQEVVDRQLRTFVEGQPNYQESMEALWDHVTKTETDVREVLRLLRAHLDQ